MEMMTSDQLHSRNLRSRPFLFSQKQALSPLPHIRVIWKKNKKYTQGIIASRKQNTRQDKQVNGILYKSNEDFLGFSFLCILTILLEIIAG